MRWRLFDLVVFMGALYAFLGMCLALANIDLPGASIGEGLAVGFTLGATSYRLLGRS